MVIFNSENDLINKLLEHFDYVKEFALSKVTFDEFSKKYNDFYFVYVLDGIESDQEEKELLLKHSQKVLFHNKVASVLSNLCSDEDAEKDIYKKAGRYNSIEAKIKLKKLVKDFEAEYSNAI